MKILKEGKLPEGTVRFECTFCGCIFLAGPTERSTGVNMFGEQCKVTNCPCCGVELFKTKQRLNRESGC